MATLKKSIYDFEMLDRDGKKVSLETLRGNVCLIINISSHDESAEKKYRLLATLLEKYKNQNFLVLLFPCSQFGVTTNAEIESNFIKNLNLEVGLMFKEIDVSLVLKPKDVFIIFLFLSLNPQVNGKNVPELYKFLKTYKPGGFIRCNFTIFITDKNGYPVERLTSNVHPYVLEDTIEKNF